MIFSSYPWKRELARDADIIRRWAARKTESEYREFLIEKKVLLSTYAIRKLFDAEKLSTKLKKFQVNCIGYKSKDSNIDRNNKYDIERFFDLSKKSHYTVLLDKFCDEVVHSYVFVFCCDEDLRIDGIFLCSDHNKSVRLLYVPIKQIITLLMAVSEDEVVESHWVRDAESGELKITNM
jgi:hypothetical protein